jgi:hypothetical protein
VFVHSQRELGMQQGWVMQHDCYNLTCGSVLLRGRHPQEDESHLLRDLATPVCRLLQDTVEVAEQVLLRKEVKESCVVLIAPYHQLCQRAQRLDHQLPVAI